MPNEKTKHTPGPWHVREGKYGNVLVEHDTNRRGSTWVLAMLDAQQYEERFMAPGTQAANANLIAAAPELLEALELAVLSLRDLQPKIKGPLTSGLGDTIERCEAALRKAAGR